MEMMNPGRYVIRRLRPESGAVREIAALDGLRALAVLLVLMLHGCHELSTQSQDPRVVRFLTRFDAVWGIGGTGVHLFFVLSGFLLCLPYARAAMTSKPIPSTFRFYVRRVLRIVPAYWVSVAFFVLFLKPTFMSPKYRANLLLHALFLHSWTDEIMHSINGVYWTLAVEFQFYLLLPLIGMAVIYLTRYRRYFPLALLGCCLFLAAPITSLLTVFIKRYLSFAYPHCSILSVVSFLSVFFFGMLGSFVYTAAELGIFRTDKRLKRICCWMGFVGVSILIAHTLAVQAGVSTARFDYFGFSTMAGLSYGGILLCVTNGSKRCAGFFSAPPLRFIGGISYSIYLWHYPLYQRVIVPFAVHHQFGMFQIAVVAVGTVAIIVPVCFLSYAFIERPFIAWRRSQHSQIIRLKERQDAFSGSDYGRTVTTSTPIA